VSALWIKNPRLSWDPVDGEAVDGGVVVENGKIIERVRLGSSPSSSDCEELDASGQVLVPGLLG